MSSRVKILIILIFIFAVFVRFQQFGGQGKDYGTYLRAATDLLEGRNPYVFTVQSYKNLENDPSDKGYAYLPGLLYIYSFIYLLYSVVRVNLPLCDIFAHTGFCIPVSVFWKIPVLLADLGVGFLLVKIFTEKKDFKALFLTLLIWFFNPYFLITQDYALTDPLPIFFLLLALYKIDKEPILSGAILSGASYALAISLKTFPILVFPVFILKARNKTAFLVAGTFVALAISLPFLTNLVDFKYLIEGAILVHSERFVQGRPFLYYISYLLAIEFFRIVPFSIYTYLASFLGWVFVLIVYLKRLVTDTFILAIIPFLTFYIFTPVLNRTYLLWFLPIFFVATYNLTFKFKFSKKLSKIRPIILFYLINVCFYIFYFWYLAQWKDGFHLQQGL